MRRSQTTSAPVHEETESSIPSLSDSQAQVRYLLELFDGHDARATGALLLDEIVPFLYCPGVEPIPTDEQIEAFVGLQESAGAEIAVNVPDTLYFWDTGLYAARSNKGRLAHVEEQEGGE